MLTHPDLLSLLEERSAAFRAGLAAAPDLEAQVPTCPEWSLRDLAQHLGASHRRWAATVAAGPADAPPDQAAWASEAPADRDALVAWSADGTAQLLSALRAAGPDRGCWTWWDGSQSPSTSGAVARHQVQHVTVHAYDVQATVGAAAPLPQEAALDGVEEFLHTCCATPSPWPHPPCTVDYAAAEGAVWRQWLSADGARSERLSADAPPADAVLHGSASDLVLALYGRVPVRSLQVEGDARLFDLLAAWEPEG